MTSSTFSQHLNLVIKLQETKLRQEGGVPSY